MCFEICTLWKGKIKVIKLFYILFFCVCVWEYKISVIHFFLFELEFELRTLCLQSRYPIAWAIPPFHFSLLFWRRGPHKLFALADLTMTFLISASQVVRITGVCWWFFFFFFFGSTGIWVRASCLLVRSITTWATRPAPVGDF
jgi:hypothetical protein